MWRVLFGPWNGRTRFTGGCQVREMMRHYFHCWCSGIIFQGQTSRTAAIFPSDNPRDRVWGVAYEIGQEYWDRVLEAKVSKNTTGS